MPADLCPEPRVGDLYLLDGEIACAVDAERSEVVPSPGYPIDFHFAHHRLTLLARREDVGAIVLAAMRWAGSTTLPLTASNDLDRALLTAVRAAKENAHG